MRPYLVEREMHVRDLGFLEDPFSPFSDSHLFCPVSPHTAVLEGVKSVVEKGLGFCVVTGSEGMGKSILANRLVSYFLGRPNDFRAAFVYDSVGQLDTENGMMIALSDALGVSRKRSAEKQHLGIIEEMKIYHSVAPNVFVIVIDTNLKISRKVLSWLSNIARESCPVVLFSRFSVDDEPRKGSGTISIDFQASLSSLTMKDAWEIVRYRCSSVSQPIRLFEGEVFRYVWDASNGVPSNVIDICSILLDKVTDLTMVPISLDIVNQTLLEMSNGSENEARALLPL